MRFTSTMHMYILVPGLIARHWFSLLSVIVIFTWYLWWRAVCGSVRLYFYTCVWPSFTGGNCSLSFRLYWLVVMYFYSIYTTHIGFLAHPLGSRPGAECFQQPLHHPDSTQMSTGKLGKEDKQKCGGSFPFLRFICLLHSLLFPDILPPSVGRYLTSSWYYNGGRMLSTRGSSTVKATSGCSSQNWSGALCKGESREIGWATGSPLRKHFIIIISALQGGREGHGESEHMICDKQGVSWWVSEEGRNGGDNLLRNRENTVHRIREEQRKEYGQDSR